MFSMGTGKTRVRVEIRTLVRCNIEIRHSAVSFLGSALPSRADCGALTAMDSRRGTKRTFARGSLP